MRSVLLAAVLITLGQCAAAKACTHDEARAAEGIASTRNTWQKIHAAYRQYAHCDDGAIGEGFTESVVHQLASNWSALPEAQRLFAADPNFEQFVVKHIDPSASTKELQRIVEYTKNQCPIDATALCQKFERAARER